MLPYFKEIKLKDITPMRYQKFINYLEALDQYSTRTIEIIHGTMYDALSMAVKLKKISSNPLLLESGQSMKFIQERLGHKNITITSDVYSHISEKLENKSVDSYESYFNSIMS
ncbi:hypothetical protein [Bacillus swezeyi]|uniref:hypothetical protein n=1 Tax=Bacillus swezeyi TaxID=1925020 RepID=UPI003F8A5DDA